MEETGARHFTENSPGVTGKPLSQFRPLLPLERSPGFQIIRTIEDPAHHVPLGQSQGVVPYRIEHADFELTAVLTNKTPAGTYRGAVELLFSGAGPGDAVNLAFLGGEPLTNRALLRAALDKLIAIAKRSPSAFQPAAAAPRPSAVRGPATSPDGRAGAAGMPGRPPRVPPR